MSPQEAELKSQDFIQSVETYLKMTINQARKIQMTLKSADEVLGIAAKDEKGREAEVCPDCDSVLRQREGKYGAFWGCSNYPACHYTRKIKKS